VGKLLCDRRRTGGKSYLHCARLAVNPELIDESRLHFPLNAFHLLILRDFDKVHELLLLV
jgi:hypothetical protein